MTSQNVQVRDTCADQAGRPLQIMLVEDDDDLRKTVTRLFETSGFAVDGFRRATDALSQLHRGMSPDVILLDLRMPDMNGWQFRIAQKRERNAAEALLVVCSGDLSEQALAIDADAFLPKPLDAQVLLDTVQRLVDARLQERARARASKFDRLRSLGELVGGIAHEVNNPLAAVVGNLELAQERAEQLAEQLSGAQYANLLGLRDLLSSAQRGADRVADVVRSVSMFAHADTTVTTVLDVHEVLESSLQVASNQIRHCARLTRHYAPVPPVVGNAAQLGQAFLNLLLSAVHTIREQEGGEHEIEVRTETGELGDAIVTISDTGQAGESSLRASIFDPCFPINERAASQGFGLAISRELIHVMGGSLEIETGPDMGSSVRVRMPRSLAAPASRATTVLPAPMVPTPYAGHARPKLLVVDDEPMICDLVSAMLEDVCDVSAFADSRAALTSLLDGTFDVVLCDLMMPDLTGMELYDRVVAERPELAQKFIFISGGAFADDALRFLANTTRPQLKKPFRRAELLRHIERLIGYDGAEAPRIEQTGQS